jgi:hypothetical protein
MTVRTYSSPEAFKQALEQRLRASEKTGAEMARRRHSLYSIASGAFRADMRAALRGERKAERPSARIADDMELPYTPRVTVHDESEKHPSKEGPSGYEEP